MKKNRHKSIGITWEINPKGNWNRLNNAPPIYTKPITQIFLDGDEFVWKHEEIMELIRAYYIADVQSIDMIKRGEAGEVKNFEKPFLEKLKDFIKELENDA